LQALQGHPTLQSAPSPASADQLYLFVPVLAMEEKMTLPEENDIALSYVLNTMPNYKITSPIDLFMCDHGSASKISSISVGEWTGLVCSFVRLWISAVQKKGPADT
jgi:hypothetical protein